MHYIMIKYFWFMGIPLGLVNAAMIYRRLCAGVSPDSPEKEDIAKLARGFFFWFSVPALVMGILQLIGGHHHPLFVFSRDFQRPTILASWIVLVALWVLMLWWVWLGQGAKTIAKYSRGLSMPASEMGVKLVTTVCTLAGASALCVGAFLEIGIKMEGAFQHQMQSQYRGGSSDPIIVPAVSSPKTIHLKDGRKVEGEIVEMGDDQITINSQGAESTVNMEQIKGFALEPNPLIELDYLTKDQVYDLRKAYVASYPYLYDASQYELSDVVFGQIEDGKPWMGMLGLAYYGCGKKSNEGLSDESRFIANPFLLIGLAEGYIFTLRNENLPPTPIYPKPKELYWNRDWTFASVKYDLSSYFELAEEYSKYKTDYHHLGFYYYNARDFGYKYLYLDRSKSHNVIYDWLAHKALPLIQYIHCGGHSWIHPQGINNMSPPQDGSGVQIWKLPARMHIKLWKDKPASVDAEADLVFIIDAE